MSGFQFKQFYIEHSFCAMKVGTDSIMLGSWVDVSEAKNILDIGTGSGLLAIMLAQKSSGDSKILGVDIDEQAIEQAYKNSKVCPWSERLFFEACAVQDLEGDELFDVIVSNPPYFPINQTENKKHTDAQRINARQTTELTHLDLIVSVLRSLSNNGHFYCVLPNDSIDKFIATAETLGLFCNKQLRVKARAEDKVIRYLLLMSRNNKNTKISYINIYGSSQEKYSTEYRSLCKEYYLNF
ncbi:tRNA1(Val) (adenine(37)-N6)-methyltransferase [Paraglaciecola sp.]|uniref:tRNA1(Val) (adenine(37)-N6)-methyltransferase n=1 Tax=Paraglaciecola sp. TaxID=1920173 RepID=UPI003EF3C068